MKVWKGLAMFLSFIFVCVGTYFLTFYQKYELLVAFLLVSLFISIFFSILNSRKEHRKRCKYIQKHKEELSQSMECYHNAYDTFKDELVTSVRKDNRWAIIGTLLFIASVVLLFGWVYYGNSHNFYITKKLAKMIDTSVIIISAIGMLAGAIMGLIGFLNTHGQIRSSFIDLLIRLMNGEFHYLSGIEIKEAKEEYQKSFDELNKKQVYQSYSSSTQVQMEPSFYDEISSSYFRLFYIYADTIHDHKQYREYCLFMVVPIKNENITDSVTCTKIQPLIENYKEEYGLPLELLVKEHKVYILLTKMGEFFSKKVIAKKKVDEWSLYHLYCMTKIAREISKTY